MCKKTSLVFNFFILCLYFNVAVGSNEQIDAARLAQMKERFLNPSRTFAQRSEQIEDVVNDGRRESLSAFTIRNGNNLNNNRVARLVYCKHDETVDAISQSGKSIQSRGVFTLDEAGLEIEVPEYCSHKPVLMLYGQLDSSDGSDIVMAFFPRLRTIFFEITKKRFTPTRFHGVTTVGAN